MPGKAQPCLTLCGTSKLGSDACRTLGPMASLGPMLVKLVDIGCTFPWAPYLPLLNNFSACQPANLSAYTCEILNRRDQALGLPCGARQWGRIWGIHVSLAGCLLPLPWRGRRCCIFVERVRPVLHGRARVRSQRQRRVRPTRRRPPAPPAGGPEARGLAGQPMGA
jgi:hypothetical protein